MQLKKFKNKFSGTTHYSSSKWETSHFGGYYSLIWDHPDVVVNYKVDINVKDMQGLTWFTANKLMKIFLLKVNEHKLVNELIKGSPIKERIKFFKHEKYIEITTGAIQRVCSQVCSLSPEHANLFKNYLNLIYTCEITMPVDPETEYKAGSSKQAPKKNKKKDSSKEEGKDKGEKGDKSEGGEDTGEGEDKTKGKSGDGTEEGEEGEEDETKGKSGKGKSGDSKGESEEGPEGEDSDGEENGDKGESSKSGTDKKSKEGGSEGGSTEDSKEGVNNGQISGGSPSGARLAMGEFEDNDDYEDDDDLDEEIEEMEESIEGPPKKSTSYNEALENLRNILNEIQKREVPNYNITADWKGKSKFSQTINSTKTNFTTDEIQYASRLVQMLDINFDPSIDRINSLRTGKLDPRKVAEVVPGNTNIYYLMEENQTTKPFSVCILCDESGSMGGDKIDYSRIIVKTLYLAFSEIIPEDKLYIYGHSGTDSPQIYVYQDKYNPKFEERINTMRARSSNYDGPVIEEIYEKVRSFTDDNIIFIVLSDGQPAGHNYGSERDQADMKRIIEKCRRDGFVTIGIGIEYFTSPGLYNYSCIVTELNDSAIKKVSHIVNKVVKTEFQ